MGNATVIPAAMFREGRWLNGMGVSWHIACAPAGAGMQDFDWRFALARIDADVPFSRYVQIDRVLTLIAGAGLILHVEGSDPIVLNRPFGQCAFAGDAPTHCTVAKSPCQVLNLFLRRGAWQAEVTLTSETITVGRCTTALIFALTGDFMAAGRLVRSGDAALVDANEAIRPASAEALLYVARLFRKD